MQESRFFLVAAHDLVNIAVPAFASRRKKVRQRAGRFLGDIEGRNILHDIARFEIVSMTRRVEQIRVIIHILEGETYHRFQHFHDVTHGGEFADGLDVLMVVINELVFFLLIFGLDLFAVENQQIEQGLQPVGDRAVFSLLAPAAVPNVPKAVLRTEANRILIHVAHQRSHADIVPSVDIALMRFDLHQGFHDLGHAFVFDKLSVYEFVVHTLSPSTRSRPSTA